MMSEGFNRAERKMIDEYLESLPADEAAHMRRRFDNPDRRTDALLTAKDPELQKIVKQIYATRKCAMEKGSG